EATTFGTAFPPPRIDLTGAAGRQGCDDCKQARADTVVRGESPQSAPARERLRGSTPAPPCQVRRAFLGLCRRGGKHRRFRAVVLGPRSAPRQTPDKSAALSPGTLSAAAPDVVAPKAIFRPPWCTSRPRRVAP